MKLKTKLLTFLVVFAVIDLVIPIPFTALLLVYVLLEKPPWFSRMVREIYDANPKEIPSGTGDNEPG